MLTKVVNPYLEDLALVHYLLFLRRHISEIEELSAEDLHPQCRVDFQGIKGLLVPLHADYTQGGGGQRTWLLTFYHFLSSSNYCIITSN